MKHGVLVLMMIAVWSGTAAAQPNARGRLVRAWNAGLAAAPVLPGVQSQPVHRAQFDVPLPAGAVQIDSTWYDLQDMGSLGTRIVATTDGKIHVAYEDDFCELDPEGCPPDPTGARVFPRAMGYAYRDVSSVWQRVGKVQDPTLPRCPQCVGSDTHGGFGTIAVLPSGRVAMATHMNEDGCDLRGDLYVEDAVGGSTWSAYLTPIADPLFPQVAALPNGSFTLLGDIVAGGEYQEVSAFQVSRLGALGGEFTCPTGWQFGAWSNASPSPAFVDGKPGWPSLAVASNGRVGIAVTDFDSRVPATNPGNVWLIESSNGTFSPGTVTVRNLTGYNNANITRSDSLSAEYRPWIHCHLAYNDTTPNVVWSELQTRKNGTSVRYLDHRSRIRHWSSVHGLSTVKQVAPGEADRYDDIDQGLSGPLSGFNTISVDWPQVGFSTDGVETYVVWLRFVDAEIDPTADAGLTGICTGIGFGDIAASSRSGGGAWQSAVNLTQTPNTDERFVSLAARNAGGRAHVVFQASATNQAGVALIGDRGTSPGNLLRRIAYLERALVEVSGVGDPPVAIGALRAHPNPAPGRVRFALAAAGGGRTTFDVYSVNGRHVATVGAEGREATWNGRDASGAAAPSGIYVARASAPGVRASVKFLLLR